MAEAALSGEGLSPDTPSVERCLVDLVAAVESATWEVARCREVTSLTTDSGQALRFDDVVVAPVLASISAHREEAAHLIAEVIPHSQDCYGRERPDAFGPPHSIIVARHEAATPHETPRKPTHQIDRFLFATRLLYAGTCESVCEVQGKTSLVGWCGPVVVHFRGAAGYSSPTGMLRRIVRLGDRDIGRFSGLAKAILAADVEPRGGRFPSLATAMRRFQMSYHAHSWDEQIIDLAIALEAALSGSAQTDVVLRLKTRAAALVATDDDPVQVIFGDIAKLYKIRSQLVHGRRLSEEALTNDARAISTVPEGSPVGLALAHAVERFRDLVRRSLLARIALAAHSPAIWKPGEDNDVDAKLADPAERERWRSALLSVLASFDAAFAIGEPQPEPEFLGGDAGVDSGG